MGGALPFVFSGGRCCSCKIRNLQCCSYFTIFEEGPWSFCYKVWKRVSVRNCQADGGRVAPYFKIKGCSSEPRSGPSGRVQLAIGGDNN